MSNSLWVLAELIIYVLALLPLFTSIKYKLNNKDHWYIKSNNSASAYILYILYIAIFSIYDKSGGDFFHYQEQVAELYHSPGLGTGLEDVYVWLISKVGFSYYLFRICVWGLSTYILNKILKYLNLNNCVSIWCFLLIALVNYSYARVSLGIVLFLYGYIRVVKHSDKGDTLYGLLLVFISLFFHKTIIFLAVLSIFSFIRISRTIFLFALLVAPIAIKLMNLYVSELFWYIEAGSAEARYLSAEQEGAGIASLIIDSCRFIPILYFILKFSKEILYRDKSCSHFKLYPNYIERLYTLSLVIIYVSTILSYLDIGHSAISYRIRNMALFPMTILVAYYLNNNKITASSIIALIILFLSNILYFLYMFYLKKLGLGI